MKQEDQIKEVKWENDETLIWKNPAEETYYLRKRWELRKLDRFLDLGCATGRHALFLSLIHILMRLRQLCCHPSLYLENYRGESAKLNLCMQLVQDCIASGHKVLIFSQFTSMLEILGRELKAKEIKFLTLTGATKTSDRLALTEQFNQDDTKVFLISLKAGGTGLNLTGADVVIHYDPWWNMSAQNQATDRAHRLGQDKTVQVFKLMVKNTIEERIQVLQEQKRDLTEAIVKEGETFISKLSTEELSALFEEHHDF